MTAQLQQAIELLQISRKELADTIRDEILENPILEDAVDTVSEEPKTSETTDALSLEDARWLLNGGIVSQTEESAEDNEPEDKLFEDFGAARLSDSSLQDVLRRARASGDIDLRRLVKEVQMWRQVAPSLLDRLSPPGTRIDESDALLKLARFIIRGRGKIAG
jgi:DNA-directed RNA polymerase specialized sigma54-like protein